MDALKRSTANDTQPAKGKKPRKAAAGQKEMLLPIAGKRTAKLARQPMPIYNQSDQTLNTSSRCKARYFNWRSP
jgi:hypothetical protein